MTGPCRADTVGDSTGTTPVVPGPHKNHRGEESPPGPGQRPPGGPFLNDPATWAAMSVKLRRVDQLLPYARNARVHSPAEVERLAESMRRNGVTMPALMDEGGTLIAGHRRLLAAELLGLQVYPTAVALGWTPEQVDAYRIADNQLGLDGSWDDGILAADLERLRDAGQDLDWIGFTPHELDDRLGEFPEGRDPAGLWKGMPEYEQGDETGIKVVVHLRSVEDKAAFERLIGQAIPANVKAVWWPAEEKARLRDHAYAAVGDGEGWARSSRPGRPRAARGRSRRVVPGGGDVPVGEQHPPRLLDVVEPGGGTVVAVEDPPPVSAHGKGVL